MRNLKRALSLALASVMLLGMMVVGTSAASINDFTDVDEINNKEAVAIATGLGIFDGYTDGSFGPEKAVTRAEAAVVIAKILHGSDVNPSNLAGAGKFTDVPAWAEGYVNLVAALKIIEGRGAGIFDPNATVTTVEFTTMLLKALGYYVDAETALNADWKLEVTSKANALGLYGDLELGMNAPLSREDVAALTFNTLFAQRVAYNDYRGQYVKATDRDVVVTNGTVDEMNTLAQNTFGLYSVEGIVVANGMTDEALSESLKSEAQTTVVFTEDTDLNQDGKVEFAEGESYDFEVETGLDMIGHAATVYYTIEKKAPVVFAIVDEATLVAELQYIENTTNFAKAANNAGFKKNTILDVDTDNYIVNYDMDVEYKDVKGTDAFLAGGTRLIAISNSASLTVDYVIALDMYLDNIESYDEDDDEYYLEIVEGIDMNVVLGTPAEGDFVVVTNIGLQDDVLVVEPATLVAGDLTKITGTAGTKTVTAITVDGEVYNKSEVDATVCTEKEFVEFPVIETIGDVTMVMDKWGEVMGLATEAVLPDYAYVAQFGVQHSTGSLNTTDVLTAHVYFADGTNGIYVVDLSKSDIDEDNNFTTVADTDAFKQSLNGTDKSDLDAAAKGLYDVKVLSNGKVSINALTVEANDTGANSAVADETKLVKGLATMVTKADSYVKEYMADGKNYTLLNNNDTVYFYVNGTYGTDLTVKVITGIKNVVAFKNDTTNDIGVKELYISVIKSGAVHTDRAAIDTMLIEDVVVEGTTVYYYNNNYAVTKNADGTYDVTFKLYENATGDEFETTYTGYKTEKAAKDAADDFYRGFYTIGNTTLKEYVVAANDATFKAEKKSNTTYNVNDLAKYDDYNDTLMSSNVMVGSITESTLVVDTCNSGLDTIAKIAKAIKDDGKVYLAYSYNNKYVTNVLFVISYTPDKTDAPGASAPANTDVKTVEAWADGGFKVTIENKAERDTTYTVELWTWSQAQAKWALQSEKEVKILKDATFATDTVKFVLTQGETYKMVVDGVVSNEVQGA